MTKYKVGSVNFNKVLNQIFNKLKKIEAKDVDSLFVWWAPAIVIPITRFFIDKENSPSEKKELLFRDLMTYALGGLTFFGGKKIMTKAFNLPVAPKVVKNIPKNIKDIASLATGSAVYLSWCTLGAVKFGKLIANDKNQKKIVENNLERLNFTSTTKSNSPYGHKHLISNENNLNCYSLNTYNQITRTKNAFTLYR